MTVLHDQVTRWFEEKLSYEAFKGLTNEDLATSLLDEIGIDEELGLLRRLAWTLLNYPYLDAENIVRMVLGDMPEEMSRRLKGDLYFGEGKPK
jgi:hypothetical protein